MNGDGKGEGEGEGEGEGDGQREGGGREGWYVLEMCGTSLIWRDGGYEPEAAGWYVSYHGDVVDG